MTADAERLDAIRERREKVQGPWFRDGRDVFSEREPSATSHDIATYVHDEDHAEFIAHAPEDIAYLLTLNESDAAQAAETLTVALRDLRQVEAERDDLRARIEAVKVWRSWYATGEAPSPSEWRDLDRRLAGDQPEGVSS